MSSISKNLFIWYYVTNFVNYLVPQPNLYNWQDDLRLFAKNKVIGVFAQGNETA